MRTLLVGALLAAGIANAAAEQRYDRTLERAVANIVAAKLGDLRGGLIGSKASLASGSRDGLKPATAGLGFKPLDVGGWKNGIAPAMERRIAEEVYR
ncbi:MAG: hypothetical protein AB7I79_07890 [Rhizobiaceae bacterium]